MVRSEPCQRQAKSAQNCQSVNEPCEGGVHADVCAGLRTWKNE